MKRRVLLALVILVLVGACLYEARLWWETGEELVENTERFDAVDRRLKAMMPKDRGLAATPTFPEDFLKVKIKVFRRDMEHEEKAYTLVKIDNDKQTFALPRGWKGRSRETKEHARAYEGSIAAIRKVVEEKVKRHGGQVDKVRAEILAPPPTGAAVPRADIVTLLNMLLTVGIVDVVFEAEESAAAGK